MEANIEKRKEKSKFKQFQEFCDPEIAFGKFLKWFDKNKRMAFLITLLVGIVTHITMITETIMSQDGLWNSMEYFRPGAWEMSLGRWGIELVQRLNFFMAIPSLATVSCILAMAITSVLLVDLFDFKSKISVIFTAVAVVLTPTLTVTLLYVYTSFAYCFNFLISVLIIWLLYKFKYKKTGFILAALCFTLSLSIYQSYVGVTVGLCIMISIMNLLKSDVSIKKVFLDIGKTILVVIIGGALYLGLTNVILTKNNVEFASNYKGYEEVSFINTLTSLKDSIVHSYEDFFMFFLGDNIVHNSNYMRQRAYMVFLIVLALSVLIAAFTVKANSKKEKIVKAILIVLFAAFVPVGLNVIDILVTENEMYALTAVQMILVIPLTFAIFEKINYFNILKWLAIVSCIYVMGTYYIATNTSYAALKLTYNQAYSTTMRVLDRAETTEGYFKGMPILLAGIVGNDNYPRNSNIYHYTVGSVVTNPTFHGSYSGAMGTWFKFLKIFYGIEIPICNADLYYQLVTSEEYESMDIFPAENSVQIVDGVVLVKLSYNPPLPY